MNSYKIFLTKSYEAAEMIFAGAPQVIKRKPVEIVSATLDSVDDDPKIPKIYHHKGYYSVVIEYKGTENAVLKYELTVC